MKHGRSILQVLGIYAAASWVVLQIVDVLKQNMGLPEWVFPLALILLLIGLPVLLTTAIVQKKLSENADATVQRQQQMAAGESPLPVPDAPDEQVGRLFTWRNAVLGGVLAFSLLFGFAGLFVLVKEKTLAPDPAIAGESAPGIAVLPFSVSGNDVDFWREGMSNALSTGLDGLAGLRTIDSRTVLARWDRAVGDDRAADLETSLAIAENSGAAYAVLGDLVATPSRMQLSATVYDVETRAELGNARVEGSASTDSTFALLDRLSIEILRLVPRPPGSELPEADLARLTTRSIDGLKAFLEGESFYRRSDFGRAIDAYKRAVRIDSSFAKAHYRLSLAYGWDTGNGTIDGHHLKALELADRLQERDRLVITGYSAYMRGRVFDALETFGHVTRRYPDDVEGWVQLGETQFHLGEQALTDWWAEADRAFLRVIALDPGLAPIYLHMVTNAYELGDTAKARQRIDAYGEVAPDAPSRRSLEEGARILHASPAERPALIAAIDTMSIDWPDIAYLAEPFWSPAEVETLYEVAYDVLERAQQGAQPLVKASLARGRAEDLQAILDDTRTPQHLRTFGAMASHVQGLELDPELVDELLGQPGLDSVAVGSRHLFRTLMSVAYLIDRGGPDEWHDRRAGMLEAGTAAAARGDTLAARRVGDGVAMLDAYASWRTGDTEAALAGLRRGQEELTGWGAMSDMNSIHRYWIGQVLQELGRPEEAESYFRSVYFDAPATLALAQIYDERGDLDAAALKYSDFVAMRRDADPNLQPEVEAARSRLEQIVSERG